jgi:hypothetical protein
MQSNQYEKRETNQLYSPTSEMFILDDPRSTRVLRARLRSLGAVGHRQRSRSKNLAQDFISVSFLGMLEVLEVVELVVEVLGGVHRGVSALEVLGIGSVGMNLRHF